LFVFYFVLFSDRRATLIVCPLSVMSNWLDQIDHHLGPHCASVALHHGAKRVKSEAILNRMVSKLLRNVTEKQTV
jgi:SNF2 family DNA or RNA helicase